MNKFAAAMIVLVFTPQLAHARPWMFFNNSNGAVYLSNDTGAPLAAILITSPPNKFQTDPALFASFPGAVIDPSDLPFAFAYFNFPATNSQGAFIGNVLKEPASFGDFYGFYYERSLTDVPKPVGIWLPEPASCVIVAIATIGLCATGRKFSTKS